jgi:Domain of unknown function (DU1801)
MPNKTQPTQISVPDFLNNYPNQKVIPDCYEMIKLFEKSTGHEPVMWGNIIGFGSYHYNYDSGREGDWFAVGFAPSKVGITIHMPAGYFEQNTNLSKLGKHKIAKCCLYLKKLEDIDLIILEEIIKESYNYIVNKYAK